MRGMLIEHPEESSRQWDTRGFRASLCGSVLALALMFTGCSGDTDPAQAAANQGQSEAELMDRGLKLLYTDADPVAAEQTFRDVLKRNPNHYGAHYQLAMALDRGGKPTEARPIWQEVARLSESIKDEKTANDARRRQIGRAHV